MVKIMENPIKMDDLGGKPTIFGNPYALIVLHGTVLFIPSHFSLDVAILHLSL